MPVQRMKVPDLSMYVQQYPHRSVPVLKVFSFSRLPDSHIKLNTSIVDVCYSRRVVALGGMYVGWWTCGWTDSFLWRVLCSHVGSYTHFFHVPCSMFQPARRERRRLLLASMGYLAIFALSAFEILYQVMYRDVCIL